MKKKVRLHKIEASELFAAQALVFRMQRMDIRKFDFSSILDRDLTKREKNKIYNYEKEGFTLLKIIDFILFTKGKLLKERYGIKAKLRKEITIYSNHNKGTWGATWKDKTAKS